MELLYGILLLYYLRSYFEFLDYFSNSIQTNGLTLMGVDENFNPVSNTTSQCIGFQCFDEICTLNYKPNVVWVESRINEVISNNSNITCEWDIFTSIQKSIIEFPEIIVLLTFFILIFLILWLEWSFCHIMSGARYFSKRIKVSNEILKFLIFILMFVIDFEINIRISITNPKPTQTLMILWLQQLIVAWMIIIVGTSRMRAKMENIDT